MSARKRDLTVSVDTEIQQSIECYHGWWRVFKNSAWAITFVSIVVSYLAGICIATEIVRDRFTMAAIAALPGLVLAIEQACMFRDRSNWFWGLVLRYQSLQRGLERGDISHEEASRAIDEIEDQANAVDPLGSRKKDRATTK